MAVKGGRMNGWQGFLQRFITTIDSSNLSVRPSRLIVAFAILVVGLFLIEIVFRAVLRRLKASLEKKGRDPETWNFWALLPAVRLAATAWLLQLAGSLLEIPGRIGLLLSAVENLMLALAIMMVAYWLVSRLGQMRRLMPSELQDRYPEEALNRLQRLLRIITLLAVAAFFIYRQQDLLPKNLLASSVWPVVLVGAMAVLVYLVIRQLGAFMTHLTIMLRGTKENFRLRLLLEAALWPVRLLLFALAIYAAKEILVIPAAVDRTADLIVNVLGTLAIILFLYRLIELMVFELTKYAARDDNLLDQSFVQLMRMIARIVVVVVGIIYLLRAFTGKPLSALLAGLGIGGLAIALAAQDTLKNFFGSLMIMLDKPFTIGQRITFSGYDGTVEQIGFRSTRLRTLTGNLVTIPNEKVAAESVENIGRRPSIRRLANITITYDTPPDKVERALDIIREILDNHEGMQPDFPPRVFFNEFNDASLNIIMLYWYHPPDWAAYMAFSERVNLQIMRAFEKEQIEFAFPSTTNYLAHDSRRPLHIRISGESSPAASASLKAPA